MVGVREIVEHTRRVLVGGVVQVPALQDADRGHPQVLDARVVRQAPIRVAFLLVVVDVGVTGVPAVRGKVAPALQFDIERDRAGGVALDRALPGCVLRAPFHNDPGKAPRNLKAELAIAVEERFARTDLPHGIARGQLCSRRPQHLHTGLHRLTGRGIDDLPGQDSHFFSSATCLLPGGSGPGSERAAACVLGVVTQIVRDS